MKVVHIYWSLTYGGIETMLVNLANAQAELGADINVVIINDWGENSLFDAFSQKVKIHNIGRKLHSKSPLFIKKLNTVIDEIKPDAIHLHSGAFWWMLSKQNRKRKVSVTLHALPRKLVKRVCFFNRLFPLLDMKVGGNVINLDIIPTVFAISQAVHNELLQNFGINSIVISNGIVTRKFMRREHVVSHTPFRIIQVGRIDYGVKGQDLVIEAIAKLKGRATIDFVGNVGENYEGKYNYLKELANKLGVTDWVNFLGKQNQNFIAENLKNYDLLVQASRIEGFGLTVAESMAAEVPTIVSTGQGPAEVTCGDKYGWTFENGNAEDLAHMIERIINNYDVALKKAVEGRKHVIGNYDVQITAKKYLENYGVETNKLSQL